MLNHTDYWIITITTYGEHAPSQDICEQWKTVKKFKDLKLQALLDEDDSQTQKQLTEQLSVSQQAVSNRLREMMDEHRRTKDISHLFTAFYYSPN